jgi:Zinc finger, C2H2 type
MPDAYNAKSWDTGAALSRRPSSDVLSISTRSHSEMDREDDPYATTSKRLRSFTELPTNGQFMNQTSKALLCPQLVEAPNTSSFLGSAGQTLTLEDLNNTTGYTVQQSTRTQKPPLPYQCFLCPKNYARTYSLRSHLRTHKVEEFRCTICNKGFTKQNDRQHHECLRSDLDASFGAFQLGVDAPGGRDFRGTETLGNTFESVSSAVVFVRRQVTPDDHIANVNQYLDGDQHDRSAA